MAGFSQTKALSTKYNSNPVEASRPFDSGRDGFVMSEGVSYLIGTHCDVILDPSCFPDDINMVNNVVLYITWYQMTSHDLT